MAADDRLRELEEKYEGYKVYDNNGESIGKVDDLFVDERDREEYIGVKMGLFGLSGTTLIPLEMVRVDERERVIEVADSKEHVKDAPQYRDDDEIDGSFEERIRQHFNLQGASGSSSGSRSYDDRPTDASGAEGAAAGDSTTRGDDMRTSGDESREAVGREEYRNRDDYDTESSMASGAGGGSATGGISSFETGERQGREGYGEGERRENREGDREGMAAQSGGDEGSRAGGSGDEGYREAYMEGYREAVRDISAQGGMGGSAGSTEGQGGRSGDREGAGEHFGAPAAGPGEKGFQDMQDYQSASTGYQPGRGEEGDEGEGRTRVRRLRRGS